MEGVKVGSHEDLVKETGGLDGGIFKSTEVDIGTQSIACPV